MLKMPLRVIATSFPESRVVRVGDLHDDWAADQRLPSHEVCGWLTNVTFAGNRAPSRCDRYHIILCRGLLRVGAIDHRLRERVRSRQCRRPRSAPLVAVGGGCWISRPGGNAAVVNENESGKFRLRC